MTAPYKLGTPEDHARDVRDLAILQALEAGGETQSAIARRFGVTQAHVSAMRCEALLDRPWPGRARKIARMKR